MTDSEEYLRAQARLERFMQRDHEGIGELGRSLALVHGHRTERATVLFHGLSATPRQFIEIARTLHERGHNVFVPRLPRHGYGDRLSEALAAMKAEQLKACVRDTIETARGLGRSVCAAGFSLGGLLAAYAGQSEPIDRVVAVAPFLGVFLIPGAIRLPLARWVLNRPNRFYWWDPIARERQQPEHGYPRYSTHAVAESLTLAQDLLDRAKVEAPKAQRLVIAINSHDPAVNNRAVERLARRWRVQRPDAVEIYRFGDLPYAHDIIEPLRYPRVSRRVTPVVVELIAR